VARRGVRMALNARVCLRLIKEALHGHRSGAFVAQREEWRALSAEKKQFADERAPNDALKDAPSAGARRVLQAIRILLTCISALSWLEAAKRRAAGFQPRSHDAADRATPAAAADERAPGPASLGREGGTTSQRPRGWRWQEGACVCVCLCVCVRAMIEEEEEGEGGEHARARARRQERQRSSDDSSSGGSSRKQRQQWHQRNTKTRPHLSHTRGWPCWGKPYPQGAATAGRRRRRSQQREATARARPDAVGCPPPPGAAAPPAGEIDHPGARARSLLLLARRPRQERGLASDRGVAPSDGARGAPSGVVMARLRDVQAQRGGEGCFFSFTSCYVVLARRAVEQGPAW